MRTANSPYSNEIEIEIRERGVPRRLEVLEVAEPTIPPDLAEIAKEEIVLASIEVHVRTLVVADDSRLLSITVYLRRPDHESNDGGCRVYLLADGRVQGQVDRIHLNGPRTTATVQVFVSPSAQLSNRAVVDFGSPGSLDAFRQA